ncbi:hypothetical protein ATCC90586_005435 [Pythium insidiosum]|nr:hypothetical protein ATCC90586_005435 [Pythium insidiosum]
MSRSPITSPLHANEPAPEPLTTKPALSPIALRTGGEDDGHGSPELTEREWLDVLEAIRLDRDVDPEQHPHPPRRRRPRTSEQRAKESQQKRQKVDQLLQLREQVLTLERTLRRLIALQVTRRLQETPPEEETDLQLATLAFMLSCSNRVIARLRQLTSQTRHGFRQRVNEVSDEINTVLQDCLP